MDAISGMFGGGSQKKLLAEQQKTQEKQEARIAEREAGQKRKESALRSLMSGGAGRNALLYSPEEDTLGSTFG